MSSSGLVGIDNPANSVRWSLSHRRNPAASAARPAADPLSVRRPEVLHACDTNCSARCSSGCDARCNGYAV
eukprot:scaffold48432_cov67-Phaeocystis_antarctica.AAC.2